MEIIKSMTRENGSGTGRTKMLDSQRLAQLGRKIIGNQNIDDFCRERDISRSFVFRLLGQKLNGPPTLRSIYRFAGPGRNSNLTEMLYICGYPADAIKLFPEEDDTNLLKTSDEQPVAFDMTPSLGLSMIMDMLLEQSSIGNSSQFTVDFRQNLFLVQSQTDNRAIVGISTFCRNESDCEEVFVSAVGNFAQARKEWKHLYPVYVFLTNSKAMLQVLSGLPHAAQSPVMILYTKDGKNVSKQMTVPPVVWPENTGDVIAESASADLT